MSERRHCDLTGLDLQRQGEEAFELQDWVELSNGCLCCSVKNEFVKALEALMTKRRNFDYILIECSGKRLVTLSLDCLQIRAAHTYKLRGMPAFSIRSVLADLQRTR